MIELGARPERQTEENEENVPEYPKIMKGVVLCLSFRIFPPYHFLAKLNVNTWALSGFNSRKIVRLHC